MSLDFPYQAGIVHHEPALSQMLPQILQTLVAEIIDLKQGRFAFQPGDRLTVRMFEAAPLVFGQVLHVSGLSRLQPLALGDDGVGDRTSLG